VMEGIPVQRIGSSIAMSKGDLPTTTQIRVMAYQA
jgi:hypothetical protein